mmetsp:Transcript_42151/g.112461  ORF Transcript_42151/g.112461 Transcript_42151/m.112461 type:complete len:83 (-) Transcript_42151:352-600(-)
MRRNRRYGRERGPGMNVASFILMCLPHSPDSGIGCKAAKAAGMACLVTTSTYTVDEDFSGADRIVPELEAAEVKLADLRALL